MSLSKYHRLPVNPDPVPWRFFSVLLFIFTVIIGNAVVVAAYDVKDCTCERR